MIPTIAVLEDDERRIVAIRNSGRAKLRGYELRIFGSARDMVIWLSTRPDGVCLISLDCDLDATTTHDPSCGSGEDVTAFLASKAPSCPVLIHSSNAMRAPAMHMELALAGCQRVRLCPFQDADTWAEDVAALLTVD